MEFDYRKLLLKYMTHVVEQDGGTFLDEGYVHDFTEQEFYLLKEIEEEIEEEELG